MPRSYTSFYRSDPIDVADLALLRATQRRYGGNTIMPLPNGATYYVFSDAYEFPIDAAITQINTLSSYCK